MEYSYINVLVLFELCTGLYGPQNTFSVHMLIPAGKSIGTLVKDPVAEILLVFGTHTNMVVCNEYHSL